MDAPGHNDLPRSGLAQSDARATLGLFAVDQAHQGIDERPDVSADACRT